jgi:hypothetical protein
MRESAQLLFLSSQNNYGAISYHTNTNIFSYLHDSGEALRVSLQTQKEVFEGPEGV